MQASAATHLLLAYGVLACLVAVGLGGLLETNCYQIWGLRTDHVTDHGEIGDIFFLCVQGALVCGGCQAMEVCGYSAQILLLQ